MRTTASIVAIVVGIVMAVAGVVTWVVVQQHPGGQKIVVADDASCLAATRVDMDPSPPTARPTSSTSTRRTSPAASTYAELDREDPNRATAMDSAFRQASLFTAVAFGVAFTAFGVGIAPALIGFGLRAPVPTRHAQGHHAAAG